MRALKALLLVCVLLSLPPIASAQITSSGNGNSGSSSYDGNAPHDCPLTANSCNGSLVTDDYQAVDLQMGSPGIKGGIQPPSSSTFSPFLTALTNMFGITPMDTGTQGAMPPSNNPMHMKSTPAMPLVTNFPWLYKDISDTAAQTVLYRGSGNNAYSNVDSPIASTSLADVDLLYNNTDTTQEGLNAGATNGVTARAMDALKCIPIKLNRSGSNSCSNIEVWTRLQYDNCANQYILPGGLNPGAVYSQEFQGEQYPWNASFCQPMRLNSVPCLRNASTGKCLVDNGEGDKQLYDYRAWAYLEYAWHHLLDAQSEKAYSIGNSAYNTSGGQADQPVLGGSNKQILKPDIRHEDLYGNTASGNITLEAQPGGIGYGDADDSGKKGDTSGRYKGNLTTINDLAQYPYERIWDPTHPFSPRWDFSGHDRDLSPSTWTYDPFTSFFKGYLTQLGMCTVRCAAVPVDILNFRANEFNNCMKCRMQVNAVSFWTDVLVTFIIKLVEDCGANYYCYAYDLLPDYIEAWEDVYKGQGTSFPSSRTMLGNQGKWPPCSTAYDVPKDNQPSMCNSCTKKSGDTDSSNGVKKCCDDLAMAVAPINTLKIRNILNVMDTNGKWPEGYAFFEYFGADMPYMRWWDTGAAAGVTASQSRNYNPDCAQGAYDAIVGVGAADMAYSGKGNLCRFGGGGGSNFAPNGGAACVTVPKLSGLTSWTELKMYQMNAMRNFGLSCLPQYEKMYKHLGSEDGALFAAGAYFNSAFPIPGHPGNYEMKSNPWPLRWRGYLTDPNTSNQFPAFAGSGTAHVTTGLSTAQVGDIVYLLPADVSTSAIPANKSQFRPMPFAAVVTGVNFNVAGQEYIDVVDVNNGKYPDVCGDTNYLGMGQTRRIYKTCLPQPVVNAIYSIGNGQGGTCPISTSLNAAPSASVANSLGSCADPKLTTCTFYASGITNLWDKIHVYRPINDVRN